MKLSITQHSDDDDDSETSTASEPGSSDAEYADGITGILQDSNIEEGSECTDRRGASRECLTAEEELMKQFGLPTAFGSHSSQLAQVCTGWRFFDICVVLCHMRSRETVSSLCSCLHDISKQNGPFHLNLVDRGFCSSIQTSVSLSSPMFLCPRQNLGEHITFGLSVGPCRSVTLHSVSQIWCTCALGAALGCVRRWVALTYFSRSNTSVMYTISRVFVFLTWSGRASIII